jgi:hypothetical protein
MRQLLRRGIEAMPAPFPIWMQGTFRYWRYPRVRARRRVHRRILAKLDSPGRVSQGPFRGMRYVGLAYCSEVLPKVFGTYERELAPALETICRSDCDRIVDIGAAEGYYAVGMALRNPTARVVAFEINPSARHYLRRLSRRNGVSGRVEIRGECTAESLGEALAGSHRPALICDCEGDEDQVLQPDRIEPLRRAVIVVETHDGLETGAGFLDGITRRLRERFAATHEVEVITSQARRRGDLPRDCPALTDAEAALAMDEGRPWAQWLVLQPRDRPAGFVTPFLRSPSEERPAD